MDQINLLVTLDRNYLLPLRVLLHSILRADPQSRFAVYVAHCTLTDADFAAIRAEVPAGRCAIYPVFVPPELLEDAPVLRRLSKASYYRLIAPDYLPQSVDRILYLDPDITVIRPLGELYNTDLQGKLIAAAGHTFGVIRRFNLRRLRIRHNTDYINSGVLLMDVRRLRELENHAEIFAFVRQNARRLWLGDQDTVNALYDGQILTLDARKYNLDEKIFRRCARRGEMDLQWVRDNTAIIHYDGKNKPWKADYPGALGVFFDDCSKDLKEAIGGSA